MHGTSPAEASFPVAAFGGLVSLAPPESLPDGASPRTWDTDFNVGQVRTRGGLRSVYRQETAQVGPNLPGSAVGFGWQNSGNILAADGKFASLVPVSAENYINLTEFGFNISPNTQITGILLTLQGYANAPCEIQANLVIAGIGIVGAALTATVPTAQGAFTLGGLSNLWGYYLSQAAVNNLLFGVQIRAASSGFPGATVFLDYATLTIGVNTGVETMQPFSTFVDQNGLRYNLVLDAGGDLWVEELDSAPNVLTLTRNGIQPGSMAVVVEGEGVQYMTFVKPGTSGGSDIPLQWTPNWVDRITQVGPGAAPVFTPSAASSQNYPIVSIVQPPQSPLGSFAHGLQSTGPGSNAAGNVVTIYYGDATLDNGDPDLIAAFNSGNPVYLYCVFTPSSGGDTVGSLASPVVVQVTSVGVAVPPSNSRKFYYFTYTASSSQYVWNPGQEGFGVAYQRTLATLTTSKPVPNVGVGAQIVVSGASVAAWNADWNVSQTPNASSMAITGSQLTAGVATFNYSVVAGSNPPAVGQLVTISGTLNANGALNVTNWRIKSVSGTTTGTFTVSEFSAAQDYPFEAEDGAATTAGTIFDFDPGAALVGTASNPIYGNATGGNLVFNATGVFIDPGTYQGTVFFITRNGYYTRPAPPVTFTVPQNTTELIVSNLPIGPPNVVARGIAITEAGQNGVPGANFFTLPTPVNFYVNGVKQTATSLFVNDNTTQTAQLFFTSAILNSATAIGIYGYNLFNQIEILNPGWVASYADRNFYGGCWNVVQNFLNLSFDGGYLNPSNPLPLGWSTPTTGTGKLLVSPIFGNSYYIQNTTGAVADGVGMITQSAFQDAYQVAIIQPNTAYSVRVTLRSPSGIAGTHLIVALVNNGQLLPGFFDLALDGNVGTSFTTITGSLLTAPLATVPAGLQLQVFGQAMSPNADIEINRMDIFPSNIPVLETTAYASYAGLPEQVDGVTGQVVFASENQQPVQAATVLYDTLYAMKGWAGNAPGSSLYSLQSSPGLEPADWNEPEVAQRSGGAIGPFAWASGEQWLLAAARAGLYLFVGGQPGKIMQEVQEVWDAVNWSAGASIWMDVDLKARRILIGLPLPTPNFWLPDAPVNAAPTSPNVVLMCNFQGLDSGEALRGGAQMHTTMFGSLMSVDMRRKWSLWQIGSPYATTVQGANGEETRFGNGAGNSKVYALDPTQATDDGAVIDSCYTTGGFPVLSKRQMFPQLGPNRVRWTYLVAALASGGAVNVRLLGNRLIYPEPAGYLAWTVPGGFAPGAEPLNDVEASLNFAATRAFLEFRQNDGNAGWNLSNMMLRARQDVWNRMRGVKS